VLTVRRSLALVCAGLSSDAGREGHSSQPVTADSTDVLWVCSRRSYFDSLDEVGFDFEHDLALVAQLQCRRRGSAVVS